MLFNSRNLFAIASLLIIFTCTTVKSQNKKPKVGKSIFKDNKHLEYMVGNLPIIITAPHGGRISPKNMPDRTYGTLVTDSNTDLLAKDISEAFHQLTGKYPHVILCHLKRIKVDCNRAIKEGAQGNPEAEKTWKGFHEFTGKAINSVIKAKSQGLYIDLHGQAHPEARLELGYLISNKRLQLPDDKLKKLQSRSSLRNLEKLSKSSFLELLRGKASMGHLMNKSNFISVPSSTIPHSAKAKYFSGGYNTKRYCVETKENIYGFQAECPRKGVRDTDKNRKAFAKSFAKSIVVFLKTHTKLKIKIKN